MVNKKIFQIVLSILTIPVIATAQFHGGLKKGNFEVGFRIVDDASMNGRPFRICIWYPAGEKGKPMTLHDYVEIPSIGGPQDKAVLKSEQKKILELPFVQGLSELPQERFDSALAVTTWASKDAVLKKGKWPLIISDTEPFSMLVTNEYLASHGFIVAVPAVMYQYSGDERTLYEAPTNGVLTILDHLVRQPYVDANDISVFGFGGGSLAAFFAATQSDKIKAMADIEGGIFMPQSKTTLSKDYKPRNFKAPLLHIVNPGIINNENPEEFAAVSSVKFRLIEQVHCYHHDFTIYGRIVNKILKQRGKNADLVDDFYVEIHKYLILFFKNKKISLTDLNGSANVKLEIF